MHTAATAQVELHGSGRGGLDVPDLIREEPQICSEQVRHDLENLMVVVDVLPNGAAIPPNT